MQFVVFEGEKIICAARASSIQNPLQKGVDFLKIQMQTLISLHKDQCIMKNKHTACGKSFIEEQCGLFPREKQEV